MEAYGTRLNVCVEGSHWPADIDIDRVLEDLDHIVARGIDKRIIAWDHHGQARVGYGMVGYIRIAGADVYLVPKCLDVSEFERWSAGVTLFLSLCTNLTSKDVVISGAGAFGASNVLLPWWADYYSRVLQRAINTMPFLRYETYNNRIPYIRGRIDWSAQVREWANCGTRIACRFRRYQADHALNRLLKWAATRFSHIATSVATRKRLGACIEEFAAVLDVPPEYAAVERIRIPASHWVYSEPFAIAKSLYRSVFPTLSRGRLPSWGFLVDMVRAFEAFVDGLVRRAVRQGRARGHYWKCGSQAQELLASPVTGDGGKYYTRPDNIVWSIECDGGRRGVVIDAKYKGLARIPKSYRRPVGSDFYQVIIACISRGWDRALIIAPTVGEDKEWKELEWAVRMPKVDHPVHVTIVKVDLRRLVYPDQVQKNVNRLAAYLGRILSNN